MPGSKPAEAFSAFINPLMTALKCVTPAWPQVSEGGKLDVGPVHRVSLTGWTESRRGYLRLSQSDIEFRARLKYEIIRDARPGYGPFRVTTRGYDYSIRTTDGTAVLDYHWHPEGVSHATYPHLHLGSQQLRPDAVLSRADHVPTGRITFESIIRSLIERGIEPLATDWRERLERCEKPHLQYRSWS